MPPCPEVTATRLAAPRATPNLTKIVATIGPASEENPTLPACVAAGLDVLRCNFSHATPDEFHLRRKNLRAAPGGQLKAFMLDTKGPEIRTGFFAPPYADGKIELKAGAPLTLTTDYDYKSDGTKLACASRAGKECFRFAST